MAVKRVRINKTWYNVFAREDGAWKMVHHQAGPCRAVPGELETEAPPGPMQ